MAYVNHVTANTQNHTRQTATVLLKHVQRGIIQMGKPVKPTTNRVLHQMQNLRPRPGTPPPRYSGHALSNNVLMDIIWPTIYAKQIQNPANWIMVSAHAHGTQNLINGVRVSSTNVIQAMK